MTIGLITRLVGAVLGRRFVGITDGKAAHLVGGVNETDWTARRGLAAAAMGA